MSQRRAGERRSVAGLDADPVTDLVAVDGWNPYLSLRALAAYSSLSERWLRSFLAAADHPLPHYRIGGRVVVKRSDFDTWMQVYRVEGDADASAVVNRLLADLDNAERRPQHARRD